MLKESGARPHKLMTNPQATARQLLEMDDEALVAAINRLSPTEAARILDAAPSLKDKTRLLWALERPKRAEVLDRIPPQTFAALVQNEEERNRYLLGCVSLAGFRKVLDLCSPAQKYYWLSLANSFSDEAANLLILAIPIRDLAEMLMTVKDFREHLDELVDYEPAGFSDPLPVTDPDLHAILRTFIELEEESYKDLIKCALEIRTYEREHPEEAELRFEPIVLRNLETIPLPPLRRPLPTAPASQAPEELPAAPPAPRTAKMPEKVSWARSIASVGEERRKQLRKEFVRLIQQEIEGLGGSYAEADVRRAMGRAQFYVQTGLAQLSSDDPEKALEIVQHRSAEEVAQAGMAVAEGFRQTAVRLLVFKDLLDEAQIALLHSLCHPDVGMDEESGEIPVFYIRKPETDEFLGAVPLREVPEALSDVADWIALARRLKRSQVKAAVKSKYGGADAAAASLVVSLLMFRRWEVGLPELRDLEDFKSRYFDQTMGRVRPELRDELVKMAREWAGSDAERVEYILMRALDKLEGFLFETEMLTPQACRRRVLISENWREQKTRPRSPKE